MQKDIKFIVIAGGNSQKQVDVYRKKFRIQFPAVSDEKRVIFTAVGRLYTPTMILTTTGGEVLMSHTGMIKDLDKVLEEIREIHKKQ